MGERGPIPRHTLQPVKPEVETEKMTEKENKETVYDDNSAYLELNDPFVLDERLKVTTIGDEVLFLEEGNVYIRQVWGARVKGS